MTRTMTLEEARAMAANAFPYIDATQQDCISDEQVHFFLDNGLLLVRNLLRGQELRDLQDQTLPLVQRALQEENAPDTSYSIHPMTGERVPHRVEYVLDKTEAGKTLLGHPFILRSVQKLQGRNFIPAWDSMVFKREGAGAAIMWHRDGGIDKVQNLDNVPPIFNVDFYLDGSDLTNCLWGILGSNNWTPDEARRKIIELNSGGFQTDETTVPIPVNAGDVLFHNVLALHGSPAAQSKLRRVVYFDFRPAEIEAEYGPHTLEYIPTKQKVLLSALKLRQQSPYAQAETPFEYQPDAHFAPPELKGELETYRFAHEDFWRKN